MRRRFGRRLGRKRSVAWLPGISTQDPVAGTHSRLVAITALAAGAATFGTAIAVTTDADLTLHGGEDAVLTRVRGRFFFTDGRVNAGAGLAANGFQLQVAFLLTDVLPGGGITPLDLTTSAGLGSDALLWTSTVLVSSVATAGVGTGIDTIASWEPFILDVDVKAKRKVQVNSHVVMWMQVVLPFGTTAADFRLRGAARLLMMRPR